MDRNHRRHEQLLYFCPSLKKEVKSKKLGHFIPLIGGFYFVSLTLLFWFDLFLEARAEIQKVLLKLTDLSRLF